MDNLQQSQPDNGVVIQMPSDYSALAVEKIDTELKDFKGGNKETAVSKFVASTLTHFCEENARFAEVVYRTPRTLSDCCAEIMSECGSSISDIDVYRSAVKHYFPNADVFFKMEIHINGDAPTEEEIQRKPEKKAPKRQPQKPKNKQPVQSSAPTQQTAAHPKPTAPAKPAGPDILQLSLF